MRRSRRGGGFHQDFGGSGEDSFVAVVVTKLTGALLFILLLTMVIMALIPKADTVPQRDGAEQREAPRLLLELPGTLPEAVVRRPYSYTFSVRGESTGPLVWSIAEPLPEGLSLDAASGRIHGAIVSEDPSAHSLTVRVTDGRSVANGVTRLPVWNPEKEFAMASISSESARFRDLSLEGWISQGFGLGLIWFGHFAGIGMIDRVQRQGYGADSDVHDSTRYRWYKRTVWCLSLVFTACLVTWMVLV